jgi:hypothetical protein
MNTLFKKNSIYLIIFILITILLCLLIYIFYKSNSGTNFYVSTYGDDNNSGLSESQPWKTIFKVNNYSFKPGDVVHFKCGDIWREQLIPSGGDASGYVTYTSYGIGDKPSIYGSVSKSVVGDWKEETSKIWTLNKNTKDTQSISKDIDLKRFLIWQENGAQTKYDVNVAKNGFIKIDVLSSGSAISNIQLFINGLNIEGNKNYELSFNAKGTSAFKIPKISLVKSDSPWTERYSNHSDFSPMISTTWTNYSINYTANCSDSNGRITFFLGSVLPKGSTLYLSNISFTEVSNPKILSDVGNIIFNGGENFGIKVFNESELTSQNKFWYDKKNQTIKVYSERNPAEMYSKIECAITRNIINESNKSYIVYNGLNLRYGGAHGIGGGNTHHISIINCDISYIGGGEQGGLNKPVRYGNGIEFWGNAHDSIVDGCNIWEIYDAGVTNQGNGNRVLQYNIIYRNNKIKNTEMSFEYWNRGNGSKTYGIRFENNICLNAGQGWAHIQRPDPTGVHVMLYSNTADTSDFIISNNTFENAKKYSISISQPWNGIQNLQLKNNNFIQRKETLISKWFSEAYPSALN